VKKKHSEISQKSWADFFHLSPFTFYHLITGLLLAVIPASSFALTGRVINQTLNRPEPNVEVSYIRHAQADVTILRDTTNSEGQYTIDAPTDPGADPPPMLLARYNGIDYPGNPAPAGVTVDIPVFETANSDTAISLSSHHILIDAQAQTVTYILVTHNHSKYTYLSDGDHGHGLELPLPNGTTEVINSPQGVHLHGSTLVDPRPIIPGNSQTFFTFPLPTSNRLHQRITYPTNALDVLVQPADTPITTVTLQDQGTVSLGNNTYHRWSATNLTPGAHIDLQIESPGTTSDPQTLTWIFGASAIVVAAFAGLIHIRSRKPTSDRRTVLLEQVANLDQRFENGDIPEDDYKTRRYALKAEVIDLSTDRRALLEQIADLDEQFENSDVPEDDYQKQRNTLKARVKTLTQQEQAR
jgi:rRNA maturation protein Nop10